MTELQKENLSEGEVGTDVAVRLSKDSLCNEDMQTFSFKGNKDSLKGKKIKVKNKNGDIVDGIIEAYQCGTLDVSVWDFERWKTAPGHVVGIRPTELWQGNVTKLDLLKNYYGFSHIILYQMYFNNGVYDKENTIADVNGVYAQAVINCFKYETGHFYAFYVDEPWHVLPNTTQLRDSLTKLRNWLDNYSNLTYDYFAAGETQVESAPTFGYAHAFDDIVDFLNCTKYENCWEALNICTWTDQRFLWTEFQNAFGTKLDHNWIHATKDENEFSDLLGHNKNLGKSNIWLYAGSTEDVSKFENFCLRAWMHGYMLRVERLCYYTYECSEPDPCDCDPMNITDGWYLVDTFCTNQIREREYE